MNMKSAKKQVPQTPKLRQRNLNGTDKDALHVYCRLRPTVEEPCMQILSPSVVYVTPPESANNYRSVNKECQFMFKQVFLDDASQQQVFETVAKPLVEGLIQGQNGLLFTYGVTGSGKTYTMAGDKRSAGIMPRCITTLFKTVGDHQANKFIFKPDKLNGFELQSEADANLDRINDMKRRRGAVLKSASSESSIASLADSEIYSLEGLDPDRTYAVFITYVEIYNNYVYDLLDDTDQKTLQNKIIREDRLHNMFVHGVTEVEVKSPSEAMVLFHKGQKRKKMAYTYLNAESSRSHSIFTIRLVQASSNASINGYRITVSQLSLVDLAGSERSGRTKNTGMRLKEASNINNSLLNLRLCFEILRENNITGGNRLVPYRDNRLTHLFKMYFEGGGSVRMILCVNPSALEFEESLQVLKFAELSQEVLVAKPTPMRVDIEQRMKVPVTPSTAKRPITAPNNARSTAKTTENRQHRFLQALNKDYKPASTSSSESEKQIDYGLVYGLPELPRINTESFDLEKYRTYTQILEQRISKRKQLLDDLKTRQLVFRKMGNEYESFNSTAKREIADLQGMASHQLERIASLERKQIECEKEREELYATIERKDEQIYAQHQEIQEKAMMVNVALTEKERQKKKFDNKLQSKQEKLSQDFENKLREQRNSMKQRLQKRDAKLQQVRKIIDEGSETCGSTEYDVGMTPRTPRGERNRILTELDLNDFISPSVSNHPQTTVSGNTIRRRSRSVGNSERWLEHRVGMATDLGTIFQPHMKKTKTLTKLTEPRDLTKSVSKYCLISQEADTDGEIETRLVKGDVVPTTGGGAQVIFNDVEVLRQDSPTRARKRSLPPNSAELTARCSIGIEGHSSKRSKS